MSVISKGGPGGAYFGSDNRACLYRNGRAGASVKPDDVMGWRAGTRKIRRGGRRCPEALAGSGREAAKVAVSDAGCVVGNMHGSLPATIGMSELGGDQAVGLDAGHGAVSGEML